jgi:hypothetical protein
MLPLDLELAPRGGQLPSFSLQVPVDLKRLAASVALFFDKLSRAGGDFMLELGHRAVLLGLAVGRFPGDARGAIVTAERRRQDDQQRKHRHRVAHVASALHGTSSG